jgi:hypothetical protein
LPMLHIRKKTEGEHLLKLENEIESIFNYSPVDTALLEEKKENYLNCAKRNWKVHLFDQEQNGF